jgi:thiamine-phosphate pyrophosphorylase
MVTPGTGASRALVDRIAAAAHAGVDLVQIRERQLDDRTLLGLTSEAVDRLRGTAAQVLVNGRVDIALAAGAAGVHLRGDSIQASRIRAIVPPGFVIGRSVHGEDEAAEAEEQGGCNYLTFGTVFPSTSKRASHVAAGLDALRRVASRVRLPVLAIGGVSVDRAPAIASAGAAGVAAIGLFASATDPRDTIRALAAAFDT